MFVILLSIHIVKSCLINTIIFYYILFYSTKKNSILTFQRFQRTVVSDLSLPLPVEVVGHHVDKVQVLGNLRHVIACRDGFKTRRHSSCQQETRFAGRLGLAFESLAQFLEQIHVGGAVIGTSVDK